ncbi:MAG: type II secretion system protein GspN [Spirobacillus cienkowskii]|jgi:type II secretion system protein N|uniref:Type II secretion system protein GspN n=1 Tax=Spirobacillus cienkowskii TaxID=495820 RepID=A0A369KS75_9BACT|nr:MAG: type II secretion system protein GspN [Spirobacillus cienkowskii]
MSFFKRKHILGLVFLFIVFIIIIIYQTFPYNILKENITNKINNQLQLEKIPLKVEIKNIRPYWFTGIQIDDLVIKNQFEFNNSFILDSIIVRIKILPLFLGKVSVNLKLSQKSGLLNAAFSAPINSLINNNFFPEKASVIIKKFSVDRLSQVLLKASMSGINYNVALLEPIINHINFGGDLDGFMILSNPSSLDVDLNLLNSYLGIDNESLEFPNQDFSKLRLKLKWNGNDIEIFKETEIISKNIDIEFYGTVETPPALSRNPANINLFVNFSLSGEVEKNFGFLIPQLLNCPSSSMLAGYLKVQLTGTLDELTCR